MTGQITPQRFHEAQGVEEWRVLTNVAYAHFRSGSVGRGVELVDAIAEARETAYHHPEIDLRLEDVTVRLTTHMDEHFL